MTSSTSVQLTPGQRCLLDLLQRKLFTTIQSYAKLSYERRISDSDGNIELELFKLKEKIKRISARQKRFTLEIINGNGNNTIPKESFFQALGLVTKEAFSKLNSKTNERRRRTTANPRFSHEAIQAKRALEPLNKRLESRVPRSSSANKRSQRQVTNKNSESSARSDTNNATNHKKASGTSGLANTPACNNNYANGANNSAIPNGKTNNDNDSLNNSNLSIKEESNSQARRKGQIADVYGEEQDKILKLLLDRCQEFEKVIDTKMTQIKGKRESNAKLSKESELIKKRGLYLIDAINAYKTNSNSLEGGAQFASGTISNSASQTDTSNRLSNSTGSISGCENLNSSSRNNRPIQSSECLDPWIDMKCDESLDGLD